MQSLSSIFVVVVKICAHSQDVRAKCINVHMSLLTIFMCMHRRIFNEKKFGSYCLSHELVKICAFIEVISIFSSHVCFIACKYNKARNSHKPQLGKVVQRGNVNRIEDVVRGILFHIFFGGKWGIGNTFLLWEQKFVFQNVL